jgi:hypothetical protein
MEHCVYLSEHDLLLTLLDVHNDSLVHICSPNRNTSRRLYDISQYYHSFHRLPGLSHASHAGRAGLTREETTHEDAGSMRATLGAHGLHELCTSCYTSGRQIDWSTANGHLRLNSTSIFLLSTSTNFETKNNFILSSAYSSTNGHHKKKPVEVGEECRS